MRTVEDVESYMLDSGYRFERIGDEIWHVSDEDNGVETIVVFFSGNIINVQVRLFRLPDNPSNQLFRRLLELNATSVIHGAFGIENDHVVLIGALELDHLDRNELQAMIESISLAIGENYDELKTLIG